MSVIASAALYIFLPHAGYAEGPTCVTCHEQIATGKSVHPALSMGCETCHTGVDATDVPHKMTNRNPRGLSSKMRDFCFTCHDKGSFTKATVHGAIMLGCTSCHSPHATDHAHMLKDEIPGLCLTCHKDSLSEAGGKGHGLSQHEACLTCHNPHSTDLPKLLRQPL